MSAHTSVRSIVITLVVTGLLACDSGSTQAPAPVVEEPAAVDETTRLNAWFEEKYAEELDFSPLTKTFVGIKDEDYSQLDDFSEAGEDEVLTWRQGTVDELKTSFDYDALTDDAKDSYDLWIYLVEQAVAAREFRGNDFVFNQMSSAHSQLPQFLIAMHAVADVSDIEAYINRVKEGARAVRQLVARSQAYADNGVHPPYFAYEFVTDESKKLISGAPFEETDVNNPVWDDLLREIATLSESGALDEEAAEQLREAGRNALVGEWKPAFESLIAWQETDAGNAADVASGVGRLPNGEAYYRERLRWHTTTDQTPEEIHQVGLREIARIHGEMEQIKETVGFEGTLQEFFVWLREGHDDRRLFFSNDDNGRQAYITAATDAIENIKSELPNFFGLIPKADLEVKRVEAFREQDGAAQHYFPSTPDGSRPGVYYAHLSDMTAMPIPELEVIAYHEGLPGHHMQIAIALELEGVPTFRRQTNLTAYAEGWALYSERLANEIPGTYVDPLSQFGRLNSELWRAVRLVLDTGLHAKGWTEEQAIEFMRENVSLADAQAVSEVRRYIVMPGQATAYMVGMLKFLELRERAEEKLGAQFDIRDFHDVCLGAGAMPLWLLERRVDRWIQQASAEVSEAA